MPHQQPWNTTQLGSVDVFIEVNILSAERENLVYTFLGKVKLRLPIFMTGKSLNPFHRELSMLEESIESTHIVSTNKNSLGHETISLSPRVD